MKTKNLATILATGITCLAIGVGGTFYGLSLFEKQPRSHDIYMDSQLDKVPIDSKQPIVIEKVEDNYSKFVNLLKEKNKYDERKDKLLHELTTPKPDDEDLFQLFYETIKDPDSVRNKYFPSPADQKLYSNLENELTEEEIKNYESSAPWKVFRINGKLSKEDTAVLTILRALFIDSSRFKIKPSSILPL